MNLVIGSTSQLSHYFPEDYIKISSREVDLEYLRNNKWDGVYITFAEQRIYDSNIDYIGPNYIYTLDIIRALLENSNKIVCYTSCELWNNLVGQVEETTSPNFYPLNNEYTISKLLLLNKISELKKLNSEYEKVKFIHPFYFNSIYRNKYFLFGKIYDSILNKKRIKVGNLDFERDMVHAKFVVSKSIDLNRDAVVGAGQLFNIRDFVQDLYRLNNMDFNYFVEEDLNLKSKPKFITAKVSWKYTYQDLLNDTQQEIEAARK